MRESQAPFGEELIETESRRLTPTPGVGLSRDSDQPMDSSNEDFLFHLYRGSEILQDNRVHEAKEELERALHLQPRDLKGQDLLAVVYFRLGLYQRAIQIYEQLRRRNTNDTALLLNLALCYLKTGQPQNARRDLEQLLTLNPNHSRAWGYLGLACERLGDIPQAQHAFQQGGHAQMAKRMAARRVPGDAPEEQPSREIRDVAGAAYQELDAGELSFALAEPTSDQSLQDAAAHSWQAHELGQIRKNDAVGPTLHARRPDTRKPDTKDGWKLDVKSDDGIGVTPSIPQLGPQQAVNRRPTLIAPIGAPPAHEHMASEFAVVERIPSYQPPSFTLDDAAGVGPPSVRRTVVAVPSPFGPAKSHEPMSADERRTLHPPIGPGSAPPQALAADPALAPRAHLAQGGPVSTAPAVSPGGGPGSPGSPGSPGLDAALRGGPLGSRPPASDGTRTRASTGAPPPAPVSNRDVVPTTRGSSEMDLAASDEAGNVRFPREGVVLHPSGVALVQSTEAVGFAARLESIRTQQSGLRMKQLERQTKGQATGESFGGIASPMVLATGEGQLILAARPGRRLHAYAIETEMCFAREDVLLGFGGGLAFENGKLTTGDGGDFLPIVQLRGEGAILLEAIGDVLTLPVRSERSLSVRREAILGWFGRLVPRAVAPNDAPCGQRGLISFAGEGRVLITSA